MFLSLIKKLFHFFLNFRYYPSKKIAHRINQNSKKIVFIDHSYHNKTKSTQFLINFLKHHFDVTEIFDDSWQGKEYPDLSFIDKDHLGVIFFQNLPSPEVINSIKCDNKIFFPMYDSFSITSKSFWDQYSTLKIVNFSSTLHKNLSKWGFDSFYIQFFPKPLKFVKSKLHKVFFWQRINQININTVEKLLGNFQTKIHLHRPIDPEHTLLNPTLEQENKFHITYSDWFKNRAQIQQKMQECDIYIAPRLLEGIGFSFLEAMAMGKAVIAANNPTMNEYIINNETGYLFDINNLTSIDFSKLNNIRINTYNYIKSGYNKWNKDKHKIIDYIYQT